MGYFIGIVLSVIITGILLYLAVFLVVGAFALLALVALAVYGPKLYLRIRAEHFRIKGGVVGVPDIAIDQWHWQNGSTCAINSQRVILSLFGIDKSEVELAGRQKAYGKHSHTEGSNDVSFVLEGYGLKVKKISKKSKWFFPKLWNGLRSGRLYLFTVNSFTLNNPDELFAAERGPVADHAIVLTAIESVDGNLIAYYTDSGIYDGSLKRVPLNALINAAGDSVLETPKISKNKTEFNPVSLDYKMVACMNCRKRLRVPFGRSINVTCPSCRLVFPVNDDSHLRKPMV